MSINIRALALCLLVLILPGQMVAEVIDDEPEVVSLYAKGKRLMQEGDWLSASKLFEQMGGQYKSSPNHDLFLFNRAKADYYFGDHDKAIAGFTFFIKKFEKSAQLPYAYFFRANAHYAKGELDAAMGSYLEAYAASKDRRLDQLVTASMKAAFKSASSVSFGPGEFSELSPERKCQLIPELAEALTDRGDYEKAKQLLGLCGLSLDPSTEKEVKERRGKSDFEIALLLPFSGELKAFADDIYNGAVIAAEMYRKEANRRLSITPFDTKGDPIDAGQIVLELARSATVNAAVGPLTSEEAAVVSAALGNSDLPLLIPAATQSGLTRLSSSTFQLSPNIELQGVRMAEYAVRELKADTAAIITPTSTDHLRMAESFRRRFKQLGGTIVATQYYRPRDNDFGKQIRDTKGMALGYAPDSTYIINNQGDTLDLDELPVRLDCLFLPGEPTTLRLLIPQINFYNLKAKLLGSDGWGGEAVLKLDDNITKGAVFPSPFVSLGSSREYFDFAAQYDQRYSSQPTRLATLGFDAVRLITGAAQNGNSRAELIAELKRLSSHMGTSGAIRFGDNRENVEMPLYRIQLNQAIRLEKEAPASSDLPVEK
ncbi:MAG: penicillin-binding protein activator [bacterium]|nr:penicillin-binding protein activator [bacterium]